ncbi:GLPGLI family protein [Amniculibacterium aquaticum]|uniref:GLPGLI family protein n=1 Tax=Amniculibacterium aquaticum TaxID=2479858 RepID=UPI000F59F0B3|nr:GLPGLI family protein [Amniculibacterium aquaticum]
MKKIISLLLIAISSCIFSQEISKSSNYMVMYDGFFQPGKAKVVHKVNYILLLGDDFSFSAPESLLEDFATNYTVDRSKIESNTSYIEELIFNNHQEIFAFGTFMDDKLGYKEKVDLKWKIENETKEIDGIVCSKATTEKYGRKWVAYFSTRYPFPIGPYKFNGLPGLVVEVFDENREYVFIMKSVERKKVDLKINFSDIKFVTKNKYKETVYNIMFTLAPYPVFEDPELKKRIMVNLKNTEERRNNPIELEIN